MEACLDAMASFEMASDGEKTMERNEMLLHWKEKKEDDVSRWASISMIWSFELLNL